MKPCTLVLVDTNYISNTLADQKSWGLFACSTDMITLEKLRFHLDQRVLALLVALAAKSLLLLLDLRAPEEHWSAAIARHVAGEDVRRPHQPHHVVVVFARPHDSPAIALLIAMFLYV